MSTPSRLGCHVTRAGHGRYRHGDYLIKRIHSPGEGWSWQVTNQGGKNWLGNFRTLREARVYVAEDES